MLVFSWVFTVRGNPPKNGSGPATLKFRFIRRFGGGVFNHNASAYGGARAAEHAVKLLARDWSFSLPPANKAIKFVPAYGLHRTPLSGRRLLLALYREGPLPGVALMLDIDAVWARITTLEGETFETKTGKPFTFEISGTVFRPSRTKYNVTRGDFAKVLELVPLDGPGPISNLVRGSAYVWAVLHDRRVRRGDW